MQVDLTTVTSFGSALVSVLIAGWLALIRYAIAQREREIERRLDACASDTKSLNERLHFEEKATIRQDGDIARVRDTHNNLSQDIEEIRRTMVTKVEWAALEKSMSQILAELQRGRSGGYPGFSAQPPKKPDSR